MSSDEQPDRRDEPAEEDVVAHKKMTDESETDEFERKRRQTEDTGDDDFVAHKK